MKTPSFFVCKTVRLNVLLWFVSCAALILSSCHSTLYNAAKQGDVETVKKELAAGVSVNKSASNANLLWQIPTSLITVPLDTVNVVGYSIGMFTIGILGIPTSMMRGNNHLVFLTESVFNFEDQTPAEVAYENNHTAVVEEFVKAGAVEAPDSVAHKQIIFQFDKTPDYRDGVGESVAEGGALGGEKLQDALKNFESCWDEHYLRHFWISCNERGDLTWQETNKYVHEEVHQNVELGIYSRNAISLEYTRIDFNKAYICRSEAWDGAALSGVKHDYYVLKFITPTTGTVRHIHDGDPSGGVDGVRCESGRFWLKDAPAEAVKTK